MRVGILGGIFNPPHIGHLVLAQEAAIALELQRVRLVPASRPPHRGVAEEPGPEVRAEMCERAVAGGGAIEVSRAEVERPGPSYTVDTLAEMRAAAPGDELFLILGSDQAAMLEGWREPERVLELATAAVVEREGADRSEVERVVGAIAGRGPRFFEMPRVDVSSTIVRRRVAEGKPIRWLVPDGVAELIAERGLYRAAGEGG